MLSVKTTENLAGVTVSGTYWDLNALYDALTNVIGEEESYDALEDGVYEFARVCGVPYYEIELTDIQYPDEIEW